SCILKYTNLFFIKTNLNMKKIILLTLFPLFTYGQWTQVGQDLDGEAPNDISGWSTSINGLGNIVAIGALRNTNSAGHVRVYENIGGMWSQIGNDINGVTTGNQSGGAICLNNTGDIVAIGATFFRHEDRPSIGHVRVFEYESGDWVQIGEDII